MKLNTIDARGLACPEPVLAVKKALAAHAEGIQIMVDNTTARENVSRFGRNAGYKVKIEEVKGDYLLTMKK